MVNVLIVEDSPVVRDFLSHILSADPEINVIGTASNGIEALEFVSQKTPDVITMDVIMPKMDGFEATRRIMETTPVPIVIVSASWDPNAVEKTFKAIEAGAVSALEKPGGLRSSDYRDKARELVQTVKLMSEVRVVKRTPIYQKRETAACVSHAAKIGLNGSPLDIKLVAIGASTGGPQALNTILSGLTDDFPPPVLIVQHIADGFVHGLIGWLNQSSAIPVKIAEHGEQILNGHAYVAPDGFHLKVSDDNRILLNKGDPENFVRPSVSYFFRSVGEVFGRNAIAVLLTGMGIDGADELKLMREKGAVTIAQDKDSSIVYGMPGEAARLDAAKYVLPLERIAATLKTLVNNGHR